MISYFFYTITSILCIFQLKNILEIYNKKFSYLKTFLILIFFIFFLSKIGLFKYLFIFKILIFISLIWFIYKKNIRLNTIDEVFLLGSIFLIYYNYNTQFSGTDIFNSYGYFSKYLFYFQDLPPIDANQLIPVGEKYSLPQILFHNFFLNGKIIFSEDVCNYSNNIFLLLNFIIIFEVSKHKKNYFHIIYALGIFYFLMNIFGAEGLTIRTDEISILLFFSLIIFIININKINYTNLFIIASILIVALLNKSASLFFIILPFLILIVKFYSEKLSLFKILLCFIIAYVSFFNLQKAQITKLQSTKFQSSTLNIKKYKELDKNLFEIDKKENLKEPDIIKKNFITLTLLRPVEIVKSVIHENNFEDSKKIFLEMLNTETHKASFTIGKIFFKNIDNQYFSFDLKKWFFLFSISLIFLFYKRKNLRFNLLFIFFLYSIFILNFSASFFNEILMHSNHNEKYEIDQIRNEKTNFPKYNISYSKMYTDYSRYNGWSIFLIFLCLTYYFYNFEKDKLKYLLIFLMLISPLRSYGNLIKVYKHSSLTPSEFKKKNNVLNEIKNSGVNNCLNEGTIFILDTHNIKNYTLNRKLQVMQYFMLEKRLTIISADKLIPNTTNYNHFLDYNFNYLYKENNIRCIITHNETEINKIISLRYQKFFNKEKFNFYRINSDA